MQTEEKRRALPTKTGLKTKAANRGKKRTKYRNQMLLHEIENAQKERTRNDHKIKMEMLAKSVHQKLRFLKSI
jgi:hypothetical protein